MYTKIYDFFFVNIIISGFKFLRLH